MRDRRGQDKGTTNKEQILALLRNAVIEKPEAMFKDIDLQTDTWKPIREEDGNAITFVQRFKDMGGIFIYLENEAELGECLKQLAPQNGWGALWCASPEMQALLEKYGVSYVVDEPNRNDHPKIASIIPCDYLIAQTGSIIVTDGKAGARKAYTDPDILLVMARADQIVVGLKEAMQNLNKHLGDSGTSQAVILTGTTRSYDIEQEIVQSVFGPRQIAVFLVDE
jgi:L-lactate dehydrogenase complex protein LldG